MTRSLVLLLILFAPPLWGAQSLSEIAVGELERPAGEAGARDPFSPAEIKGEIDVTTLSLEGFIIGSGIRIALLSGRVVREADTVGLYSVANIEVGKLLLKSTFDQYLIRMDGYTPPLRERGFKYYTIEFRRADIRDALNLLARAAGYNVILPESMEGKVSLSFDNIAILDAIKAILKVNSFSYAIESGIMRVGKSEEFKGGTDLLAVTIPLKFATAASLVSKITPLLSKDGSVTAEERMNILSLKDYDANIENVRRYLNSVDVKDQQVLIEAHIVDASNDFSRSLGVEWGVSGTPHRLRIAGGDSTSTLTIGPNTPTPAHVNLGAQGPTSAAGFRIGRLPGGSFIDLQLTAAESRGDVKIISKPSVVTINNLPAQIRSGVTIYVKSTSDISIGGSGGSASGGTSDLQEISTGIQLDVTPQITPDNFVKLTIKAEESEADFSRTVDGIPAIIDNIASTTVILKNGETAVIGGLIKKKESVQRSSVPGFSKIPVVGLFFKSKTRTKNFNELMVFITPRVID